MVEDLGLAEIYEAILNDKVIDKILYYDDETEEPTKSFDLFVKNNMNLCKFYIG